MKYEFILQENVLSDNILEIPTKGYIFKGGYIAIVREFTFANEWCDKELPNKRFRSKDRLYKYLNKKYPHVQYEYDFCGTCLE